MRIRSSRKPKVQETLERGRRRGREEEKAIFVKSISVGKTEVTHR